MDKKSPPQLFADNQNGARIVSRANPKRVEEPKFTNTSGFRDKPDGILNPVAEAGWFLERERIERKLTLDDIAEQTGIHPFHIEAIERGDMTHMPARLEALEMIAIYAHHLGFEPEPLLEHYANHLPATHVAPRNHPANPAPLSSAKILPFGKIIPRMPRFNVGAMKLAAMPSLPGGSGGIVAAITGFVMLSAGSFWMFSQGPGAPAAQVAEMQKVDPMPTATTGPEAADVKVSESPVVDQVATVDTGTEIKPDDPDAIGAFIEQLDGDETTASTKPVKKIRDRKGNGEAVELAAQGRVLGAENESSRITLTAKAPVWISIDDAKGKSLMTQMLNPGDSYRVPDQEGLVVLTRDGGRVAFSIDGVEKGLLGTPGEIITGSSLSIEELQKKG
jgi:cytoskeleton protein RodZ